MSALCKTSRLTTSALSWSRTKSTSTSSPIRTYYSIHHPNPAPFPPIQTAILSSALTHVPRLGFTQDALLAGAKENSYLEVSTQLFPRGSFDLVHYHLVSQRLSLKDTVQFPPDTKLSVSQRVKILTWARLQANKDILPYCQDALSQMSLLENIPASLKELGNLADEILWLAGDKTVDFGWYTKRASLSSVYAASEMFMTTDRSHEFENTKEFLERRLEDATGVKGAVGSIGQYAGWFAGNGLGLARAWGMKV